MKNILIFLTLVQFVFSVKPKVTTTDNKTIQTEVFKIPEAKQKPSQPTLLHKNKTKIPIKVNKSKPPIAVPKKNKLAPKVIQPYLVQRWAQNISDNFYKDEKNMVYRDLLIKSFSDMNTDTRNGHAIVDKIATVLSGLLTRRAQAAENIMKRAEDLARTSVDPPTYYKFDKSSKLDEKKKYEKPEDDQELMLNCSSFDKVSVTPSQHFGGNVTMEMTSVQIAVEVFECDPRIRKDFYWSEGLFSAFRENYAKDASLSFQYYCSAKGFMRHFPAASWDSLYSLELEDSNFLFDCRLRPWYVSASGAPRDVLILLDASGSMSNSSNQYVAEVFTSTMLNALTDDDQVNVFRFNTKVQSPISCFNDRLVSANHVNSAAMMAALKQYKLRNETKMAMVLEYAVKLLVEQRDDQDRPNSCQQAIVLLADEVYANFTEKMMELDPEGRIRLFVLWLHDPFGLRDNTREYGESVSCARDGYFAELTTHADATEQVMKILRVLERPLVHQRKERLRVYSDLYAHIEDPRRGEENWHKKEKQEQFYRYGELRKCKEYILNESKLLKDFMYQESLDKYGHYYEGEDIKYKMMISVSVPVFDYTTLENITKTLEEENQRNATRTYPVNRLLGVAGIDIPLEQLKLLLPYHQVGAGGAVFILDHRGNIVIHDNIKPVFDGDILKPGYRTVDMLDLEQSGNDHEPRRYPKEWVEFRKAIVVDEPVGARSMFAKDIYNDGLRATRENRTYYWKRVLDHYTVVVVLPLYNRRHTAPELKFTQQIADEALQTLRGSEFSVHPNWLYCRHVEPHFDARDAELLHFIRRRRDESNFPTQKLKHLFSPLPPTIFEKTYNCDEELITRLCKEAVASSVWAKTQEDSIQDCSECELGFITAFFATESGLTRWRKYARSHKEMPPDASIWPQGPDEHWYKRAVANSDTLIIHAPVSPVRKLRNTFIRPPPLDERYKWMTAARTVGSAGSGIFGVAGYHFPPNYMEEMFDQITNFPCIDDDNCEPQCDGKDWSCVLVDEGGWIVANGKQKDLSQEPIREHLATVHPAAMAALLNASVFQLHWLHDYQGVCFLPKEEDASASMISSSLLRPFWNSVKLLFHVTRELMMIITILGAGGLVSADTEKEKAKRRNRLRKDYEREKYERLFDSKVLINETRYVACDRSRPLYELKRTPRAVEALQRPMEQCHWPVVGAVVPKTNLILLAIFNPCPYKGRPVPNPLNNVPVVIDEDEVGVKGYASKLACWRNRKPLPVRPPHTKCFPHNYPEEEGYRQCGPWLPNPEEVSRGTTVTIYLSFILLTQFLRVAI